MQRTSRGTLQAATVLAKNTETLVGQEIACIGYNTISFFCDYVNGDETTLILRPYFMHESGGDAYQDQSWTAAAGVKLMTKNSYTATATMKLLVTLDVSGFEFVKLMQTADNTGTPTGTLAVSYTMTSV